MADLGSVEGCISCDLLAWDLDAEEAAELGPPLRRTAGAVADRLRAVLAERRG